MAKKKNKRKNKEDKCLICNHSRRFHDDDAQHSYWCHCREFVEGKKK